MQFVYPSFLIALLAISLPIIIHLFNFKKFKKVYFTNLKFLKNVDEETKSKSRLKHLLILFTRILFITFLVLAFAQPFIPALNSKETSQNKNGNNVSIFIDNSFSMNNVGVYGQLFNTAKQYAFQIMKSNPPATKYRIITNENSENSKRLLSKESALSFLSEIGESSQSKSLQEIYTSQKDLNSENKNENTEVFILSDFQKDLSGLDFLNDTTFRFHLIPLIGNNRTNVSVDSCWFETPVRKTQLPEELFFKITNRSEENLTSYPIRLTINGLQKAMINIDLSANSSTTKSFSYTISKSGIMEGEISIEDYPIAFDNKLYFSYTIPEKSNILVVTQGNLENAFKTLFSEDSSFNFTQKTAGNFTFSDLQQKQMVILNGLEEISTALANDLKKWTKKGGKIVVFPPNNGNAKKLNEFLVLLNASSYSALDTNQTRIHNIEIENPLYRDVFDEKKVTFSMPKIKKNYPILIGNLPYQILMSQVNGKPFLLEQDFGKGKIYQFSVSEDASFSSFPRHALFVVTLFQMGNYNINQNQLFHTLGNTPSFTVPTEFSKNRNLEIEGKELRFIPEVRNRALFTEIWFYDQIKKAGVYRLLENEKHSHSLAINYNQKESGIEFYSKEELTEIANLNDNVFLHTEAFDQIGKTLNDLSFGKQLWQYMILLALLMLLFEILLIKLWK